MPVQGEADYGEWIWVPPGFAHGTCFPLSGPAESTIEYFCTGRYNPTTEASISPLASDLDWSLCDPANKARFDEVCQKGALISDKDRDGLSATEWQADRRSGLFRYGTAMNA
jgi:dTDP-4-dehydrorhamnose 3,5-epimerase-like enzyme